MRLASSLLTVFTVVLLGPAGYADEADVEISEREFIQQSIQRIKRVEQRVDDYDDYVQRLRGRPGRNAGSGIGIQTGPTMDPYGRTAGGDTRLRRLQFDVRSLRRKVEQTLENLDQVRRQAGDGEAIDRDAINANVRRLERDVDDIERDLRRL